jgi:hypothetical protein
MKSLRISGNLLAVALLALAYTSPASAQATRTWVSGVGDDANPCSRTAPCKTFAGAISKTADGGEINCLDPGGFGAVTITKSIKIDCGGFPGGILNALTTGIIINANATTGFVTIRNLEIMGSLTPTNIGVRGINYISANTVHLENVHIVGQSQACVTQATGASSKLTMVNVTLSECGSSGLAVSTSAGQAVATTNNVRIFGGTDGVTGGANSFITLRESEISENGNGVRQTVGGSSINLVNSQINHTSNAINGIAGSTVRITGSTFAQNGNVAAAGTVLSDGTNTNIGNGIVGAIGSLPAPIKF